MTDAEQPPEPQDIPLPEDLEMSVMTALSRLPDQPGYSSAHIRGLHAAYLLTPGVVAPTPEDLLTVRILLITEGDAPDPVPEILFEADAYPDYDLNAFGFESPDQETTYLSNSLVGNVIANLNAAGRDVEAAWLGRVLRTALTVPRALGVAAVTTLLAEVPKGMLVREHVQMRVSQDYANGVYVWAEGTVEGDEHYYAVEGRVPENKSYTVIVTRPDGVQLHYERFNDGSESLGSTEAHTVPEDPAAAAQALFTRAQEFVDLLESAFAAGPAPRPEQPPAT